MSRRPLRVLTWHVHGTYLWSLTQVGHRILLPVRPGDGPGGAPEGYAGRAPGRPWPDTVEEVPADAVAGLPDDAVDVVVTQSHRNWEVDRYEILSPRQRALPRVHVEHDPPREHPTDTRHPVDDPGTLIVHVTHFNRLMWDCGDVPTTVVEHGVPEPPPGVRWTGELERALVVVNGLDVRGRRVGADIVARLRRQVPLDVVGMGSEAPSVGGLGEVPPAELPAFAARYRTFVHPIRYTSLGLGLCEALMLGMPVVGLATTELPTVLEHGRSGLLTADADALAGLVRMLLDDRDLAARIGGAGRDVARTRFGLGRFRADWDRVLRTVAERGADVPAAVAWAGR
ncbi:MAG TPA: glycosyltransferase family 4 protein [Acidimicrobiales bacterium]